MKGTLRRKCVDAHHANIADGAVEVKPKGSFFSNQNFSFLVVSSCRPPLQTLEIRTHARVHTNIPEGVH